jgi:hypothetical protein
MKKPPFAAMIAALTLAGCSQQAPAPQNKASDKAAAPAYFKVDAATAGTITGKISFTGKKPARKKIDISEDPMCAKMHPDGMYDESVVVNPDGTLANVFVYVKSGLEGKTFEPPSTAAVIDQKGCQFGPRVIGLQTGQLLNVTNSDPVTHNIHPLAEINRAWNQSQDPGSEPLKRHFQTREIMIRVKCNIHSWMRAWIGVVEHPYFAVTGKEGTFTIPNLPPGDYTLEAVHEVYGKQELKVSVPASGKQEVAFTFKGE